LAKIINGDYDDYSDEPFYMAGNIESVEKKWQESKR
jgi:F0F1-type ATP synthase beta subunit